MARTTLQFDGYTGGGSPIRTTAEFGHVRVSGKHVPGVQISLPGHPETGRVFIDVDVLRCPRCDSDYTINEGGYGCCLSCGHEFDVGAEATDTITLSDTGIPLADSVYDPATGDPVEWLPCRPATDEDAPA